MGKVDVSVTLTAHGPLFDGTATGHVRAWLDDVKKDIAQEGVNQLRSVVMDKTGRGTGHYQSEITTRTTATYHDEIIYAPYPVSVYGPWLEGFSERNRSTRFKGYHLWRLTRQKLQEDAPSIAERRLPELIQRLEGM